MSKIVDDSGFWTIKDNPLTKEGVFPYLGKTISPELEPTKVYMVYRSFDEISSPATLESFNGIPFIDDHEMIGEEFTPYDQRPAAGILMNPVKDELHKRVNGDLRIFSEAMKEKINGGKKELSLGYTCQYKPVAGVFAGSPYEFIQTDIRGNHLALVENGRMGRDVRVCDRAFTMDALELKPIKPNKENTMADEEKSCTPCETECKDENVDKRKFIDEIGGILKGKVDEELWRTVIGKVEKVAYNGSESTKADDEQPDKKEESEVKTEEVKAEENPEVKEEKTADEEKSEVVPEDKPEGKPAKSEEVKQEEKKEESKEDKSEDACEKDACAKDEFFDGPGVIKLVNRLVGENTISEEAASAFRKGLSSLHYKRAENKDASCGMDTNDISKIADAVVAKIKGQKGQTVFTLDEAEKKDNRSWLDKYKETKNK